MSCNAVTVHDGHEHLCTIVPAPHPVEVDHMAPCGQGRLHRWKDEMITTDAPPETGVIVCAAEPASAVPAAVRAVNTAVDAGWTAQLTNDPAPTVEGAQATITLTLERGQERGHVVWKRIDADTWRFHVCAIDGKPYGARQIAARLNQPAPPPVEERPPHPDCPNGCQTWCGGAVCVPGRTVAPAAERDPTALVSYAAPNGLATVTPIRPEAPLATVHPLPTIIGAPVLAPVASVPGVLHVPAVIPGTGGGPVMPTGNLDSFMAASARATPVNGNTPWATRYANELRQIIEYAGRNSPRNLQVSLGPSELGVPCDRQVAGKMAGIPATNHVVDPWPSIVGTAGHAWLAETFKAQNALYGLRWVPENRVTPHPEHPGTADLYDGVEQAVVDWKLLGFDKIEEIARKGPSVQYRVQLLLYGLGYRRLGLPVRRVVLAALPRTKSTLDGMYVWDHELTAEDDACIEEVFKLTAIRKQWAAEIVAGNITLHHVPATPDSDTCYFCPFYRPDATPGDGGIGCPGTVNS